jgi:ComF family protein
LEWKALVDSIAGRLLQSGLPPRCLLCAGEGTDGRDLCEACAGDLRLNAVCCERCALPLAHAASLCGHCLRRPPPFAAAWVPFIYAHPLDLLEARFKFGADLAAGRVLADLLIERARAERCAADSQATLQSGTVSPLTRLPECLLCVPLHTDRLRERGYNQALELAKPLAQALGLRLEARAIERVRSTHSQTGLDAKARRKNLRGAFVLRSGITLPAHVAILDDVMTTGTTLRECALTLRRAGVSRVDVWALARAPGPSSAV